MCLVYGMATRVYLQVYLFIYVSCAFNFGLPQKVLFSSRFSASLVERDQFIYLFTVVTPLTRLGTKWLSVRIDLGTKWQKHFVEKKVKREYEIT